MKTGFQRLFDAAKPRVRAIVIATIVVAALLAAIFAAPVKSFLKIIPDVLTWPIALLLIIIYLGSSSNATNRLSRLFARFGSLKLLGSEVTFTTEGARQLFSDAEDAFEDFKRQADHEFRRQVRAQNLQEKMSRIFRAVSDNDDLDLINIAKKGGSFRCTVHVEDILFKDTLYQLLEYYPSRPGRQAGRRFSVRFGIIGLAWRMECNEGHGKANARTERELIKNWGMTRDEADDASRQRPSYLCIILKSADGAPMGVLFMDSQKEDAFGDEAGRQDFENKIIMKCENIGLRQGLENVVSELRKYRVGIRIHD